MKKKKPFVFDKSTGTISGVTPKYKTYFSKATSVTFPNQIEGVNVEVITGDKASLVNVFGANNNTIQTIRLPRNLKTIKYAAFAKCHELTSITIRKSVTTIGYAAFYSCRKLISVAMSNSVTTIEQQTFRNCRSLTSITIPKSLTTIGKNAFTSCTNLSVTLKQTDPTQIKTESNAFSDVRQITVPDGQLSTYIKTDPWSSLISKFW